MGSKDMKYKYVSVSSKKLARKGLMMPREGPLQMEKATLMSITTGGGNIWKFWQVLNHQIN